MNLYIKLENNIPIGYPTMIENLINSLSGFNPDTNNYGYVKFNKCPVPIVEEPYLQVELIHTVYNNECYEMYKVRTMTQQEKNDKIASMQSLKPYASWIFDEPSCRWIPPTPMPDGKYRWNEETVSWIPDEI